MKSMPWRATAVSALLVSACSCDPETAAPTLTLVAPRDGQTVNRADDLDPSREGVQVEAEVAASGLDGSTVTLAAAEGTFAEVTAKIENGRATLVYTLSGSVKLVASATDAQARTATSAPATVTFDDALRACRFLVPADGATLGQDGDESATDGFQVTARVRCVGVELGNPIDLFVGGARWAGSPLGAGGIASFPSVEFAEGANVLEARTKTNAGEAVTARSAVTVDTGACRVTVQPPTATIFNARGEGQGAVADLTPGGKMNARLAIDASACPGASITLKRGTAALATLTAESAAQTVEVELEDGTAELRAILGGSARGASPLVRYSVDAVVPTLVLDAPAGGESFHDGDDTAPALPGLQVEVKGRFTGIGAGRAFEIVLEPGTAQESVLAGVLPADERFSVPVTLANGSHQLLVRARRASGSTAASPSLAFSSSFLGASLAFASPADGTRVTLANDAKPDVAGFQIGLSLVATNLDGSSGQLTCSGQSVPFTIATGGRAEVALTYVPSGCGASVQSCVARITATGGSVFETAPLALLVDPTPPTVVLLAPEAGAVLSSSLVTVSATTSCPGETQTAVLLRGTDVLAGPAPIVGNALSFADVALFPGESALVLRVSDEAGNATPVAFTVIVDSAVPLVSFLEPATTATVALVEADDQQGTLADGLQRDVVVEVSNELVGTAVELNVGGRAALTVRTVDENGRKIARFAKVTLPEGDTRLIACATDEALGRGCRTLDVKVSTGRPSCVVSAPADGAVLGQSADLDGVEAGLQADVTVTTSAAAGTLVQLELIGPDGVSTTASAAVAAGLATFAARTFAVEGAYVLQASCRNDGGVPGLALANHVAVDFSVPTFTILEPEADQIFNLASPDRGAAEGFQLDVRVQVDEVAPGAWVTLEARCGGAPATFGPVAVNAEQLALFRAIDVPSEGACDLTVTVTDVAGNVAAPVVRHIAIDRVAPTILLLQPAANALFGRGRDAVPATPEFDLAEVVARVTGAAATPAAQLTVGSTAVAGGLVTTVDAATQQVRWALVRLPEGPNTLTVRATDGAGNEATQSLVVTVDTLGPVVTITSLVNNLVLTARNDVDPSAPGLQMNLALSGEQLVNGTTVRICSPQGTGAACHSSGGFKLAEAVLGGGAAILPRVTLPEGSITVFAEATDLALNNSPPSSLVTVTVDSIGPKIETLELVRVAGTAETVLDTAGGTATFGAPADAATAPGFQTRLRVRLSGIESGRRAQFIDSNPSAGTVVGSAAILADGTATLDVTLPDGGHRIGVLASDVAGNPSSTPDAPVSGVPVVQLNFAVDVTPPAVAFIAPLPGRLLAADDLVANVDGNAASQGLQYDVVVDSDAGPGSSVQLTLDGQPLASAVLPSVGRRVTLRVTIPEGAHSLSATVIDSAGNGASAGPVALEIDTVAPTLQIVQPQANTTISTDADPATDGFQINVQVSYARVETGRTLTISSSKGGLLASATTDAGGSAVFPPVTVPSGVQQLTASVTDQSGNVGRSPVVTVTVDVNAPSISFASPDSPLLFGVDQDLGAGEGCQVTVRALSDTNGAQTTLLVDHVAVGAPVAIAGGEASFTGVTIAAGATVSLQLRAVDSLDRTGFSVERQAICDLTRPTVAFVDPSAPVKYVAAENPGGVVGARADLYPGTPLDAVLRISVGGAQGGTVALSSDRDGLLATQSVNATGTVELTFSNVSIPSAGAHTLTVTAKDSAGNTETATLAAESDVLAPAATNPTATITDGRAATARLTFTAPGSDGAAGGAVAGYSVRRIEATPGQTGLDTEAKWQAAAVVTLTGATVVAPGAAQVLTVPGLAFEKVYFIAVRAFDALGNLAPLGASARVDLALTRRQLGVPSGSNFGQVRMVVGDLDGDGRDDLVSSSSSANANAGEVDIYYGNDGVLGSPASCSAAGALCVALTGATGSHFGSALAIGDVNDDGLLDLIVGADWQTAPGSTDLARDGAVSIFLGRANTRLSATSTPDAIIYGKVVAPDDPKNILTGIGNELAVVGDLNDDGFGDLVVASPNENNRGGRLYVIAGRATWPASLSTTTDALATITAPSTRLATEQPQFGIRLAALGDLNGDGAADFATSAPGAGAVRPTWVVSGKLARGTHAVDAIAAAINPPTTLTNFFGYDLAAGDWVQDGKKDLAASDRTDGRVYVYSGVSLGPTLPTVLVTSPPLVASVTATAMLQFPAGFILVRSLPDVTGDGIDELAATLVGTVAPAPLNESRIWFGRVAAKWIGAPSPLAQDVTIGRKTDPVIAREGGSFGVRIDAGKFVTNGVRDIILLDLGGTASVLSKP